MAKTTAADAEYQQGRWHLAQILRVRWASMPGVGTDAPPVLAIQIKLVITHRWPPTAPDEDSADADVDDVDLEVVGGAAVIYVACDANRRPLTSEGNLFLGDLGIGREATRVDLEYTREWFRCQFGPPDSIYGFQSIVRWQAVDDAWATNMTRRVSRTGSSRPRPELKLDLPGPGVATQDGVELDFTVCPLAWYVLKRLAMRYPHPYRRVDLGIDAWAEASLESPSSASVYQAVSWLKKILEPSGLALPRPTNRGYRLKLRPDKAPHDRPDEAPHDRPDEAPHDRPGEAPHDRSGEAPHDRPGEAPHDRNDRDQDQLGSAAVTEPA